MTFNPDSSCPSWCDPRCCHTGDVEYPEHRTAGVTWTAASSDTELIVRTRRLDHTGRFGHTGDVMVQLALEDTQSLNADNSPIAFQLNLDPADIRMLAAALIVEAEKVERLLLAGVAR